MGNGALAIGPKLPRPSSTLPIDCITITVLDVIKQAIEVVHVKVINPIKMRVPRQVFGNMGFD